MIKPSTEEYDAFYKTYIDLVEGGDILQTLARQSDFCATFLQTFVEKGDYRYADGKWSVKQLLQHIIDGERVFSYRIVRISHGDQTPIPGFDENDYADAAPVDHRTVEGLIAEFMAVRSSTYALVMHLTGEQWMMNGVASGSAISVRALVYIIVGHCAHHIRILEERYS